MKKLIKQYSKIILKNQKLFNPLKRQLININKFQFIENNDKKDDQENRGSHFDSDYDEQDGFYNKRKKLFYLLSTSAIVVSSVYFSLQFLKPESQVNLQRRMGDVTYVGKALIGGPWALKGTDGKPFSYKNLLGKYYLIYFGFTRCPDVCPMSLQKIVKAVSEIKNQPEYNYFDIEVVFVSVDPDRDSLSRIRQYTSLFNKDIIGVTGESNDDPNLKDTLKKFKIHSSKIYLSEEDQKVDNEVLKRNAAFIVENMGESNESKNELRYSLDHTIVTYLMGTENEFLTYLSANLTHQEMKGIILEEIMSDLNKSLKKLPNAKR